MNAKDAILATMNTGERVMDKYLDGLSDAELLIRPVDGQNTIAWQLGHLISVERRFVDQIKPGSCPQLPPGFDEAHGRDDGSTKSDDPSRFSTKEQYLSLFAAQRRATKQVVADLTDAELDAPGPESARQMAPTVGHALLLMGTHPLMHLGQFVSVRRKLGKPVAM
jgi:uncharacterized damage-inducible protein DinB